MDEILESLGRDIDLLLTEVCMTAAFYGLEPQVAAISEHLRDLPGKQGVATLAQTLAKIAVKDFDSALSLANQILDDPNKAVLHPQASEFRDLAAQLAAGQQPTSLSGGR
jgi:hypothetical protein